MDGARKMLEGMARYHRHRVHGLEHVPAEGPALFAVNHSLATYDVGLLVLAVYKRTGRIMRGLGDRSLFTTPGLRDLVPRLRCIEATRASDVRLQNGTAFVPLGSGKDSRFRRTS